MVQIFDTRNNLFRTLPKNMVIAEIGVFKGEFSKFIYEFLSPKELHLIDIFEGYMGSGDKDGNNMVFTVLEDDYQDLIVFFEKNKNVFLKKGLSSEVLKTYDDDFFDLVYIDASHEYEDVKSDLSISYNKVKNGGFICGHDYLDSRFPGVCKAVNEFCIEKNLKIDYLTQDGCPTYIIKKLK